MGLCIFTLVCFLMYGRKKPSKRVKRKEGKKGKSKSQCGREEGKQEGKK